MVARQPAPKVPTSVTSLGRALTLVHTGQAAQRSVMTERLGLTRTATGAVLRELERLGLVRAEAGMPRQPGSSMGRPSHHVEIHPDAPAALALQVQTETLVIADVHLGGGLGTLTEVPLPRPATPARVLTLAARQLAQQLAALRTPCAGIGVALPSAVGDDGTALAAFNLGWPGAVPVRSKLSELLQRQGFSHRVTVGNDADLAALAEYRHGAGRGASDLLYLTTGQRGVGGGLVVNGRLHLGSAGYALEVGHLTVAPGGRPCHCGNAGCLEVEADPAALLAAAGRPTTGSMLTTARDVISSAPGDPAARTAVLTITERLAVGLASLVNVLNPDRVVLGELFADVLAVAEPELRAGLTRGSFLDQAARVELLPAGLPRSTLIGAGEIALQPLLDDPRLTLPANHRPTRTAAARRS